MGEQTDERPSEDGATPVPDLIERYRSRRDAWIAQADELARLRDEVRGSAEREAMEIVTAARRDVRKIVMEARRELLVLSAQVQAALGEATTNTDPATLLHKAGITAGDESVPPSLTGSTRDTDFAPESAVDDILNEVHADITALVEDARALPLHAVPLPKSGNGSNGSHESQPYPAATPAIAMPPTASVVPPRAPFELRARESTARSDAAPKALLLSPFPSEAVPVPSEGRFKTFVSLFVGLGILIAVVSIWWISSPGSADEPAAATSIATDAPADAPPATPSEPPTSATAEAPARTTTSGNLSVVVEAIRDVWVRTTVDGRVDEGRTLAVGQVIDVSADRSISLRVGDAGAIMVSVNGGEKRPLGRDGQVITRQFAVEGAKTPERAPAPSGPAGSPATAPVVPPTVAAPPVQVPPPARAPVPPSLTSAPSTSSVTTPSLAANQVRTSPAPSARPESTVPVASATTPVANAGAPAVSIPAPSGNTPAPAANTPATAVVAAARQWLDAYHRQDRAAMAALSTENLLLADERRADERFPPGLDDVTRTLDRVSVQIAADTAVLTAVMTEQSGAGPVPRVSPVSQVWVLAGGGQWKVRQARFVSEARLNQIFR